MPIGRTEALLGTVVRRPVFAINALVDGLEEENIKAIGQGMMGRQGRSVVLDYEMVEKDFGIDGNHIHVQDDLYDFKDVKSIINRRKY